MESEELIEIAQRIGTAAAIYCWKMDCRYIGIMITASHNPAQDNGVKIVSPSGEMMEEKYEEMFNNIVNCSNDEYEWAINQVHGLNILIGYDTRQSGPRVKRELIEGIHQIDSEANIVSLPYVTTPQLHYYTHMFNNRIDTGSWRESHVPKSTSPRNPYLIHYMTTFARFNGKSNIPCYVDAANGVGAITMKHIAKHSSLKLTLINDETNYFARLNYQSGSDYVMNNCCPPRTLPESAINIPVASLDGDADRLVFGYMDEDEKWHVLNGDYIAALILVYLLPRLTGQSVGVIHTAYTNGAFLEFVKRASEDYPVNVELVCVKTGVKHLHHAALEYDVGIYFEANGHGTVLFRDEDMTKEKLWSDPCGMIGLFNPLVGDGISNLLGVLGLLQKMNLTIQEWEKMFTARPSKNYTITVPDKNMYQVGDVESRLDRPSQLQDFIDDLVKQYHGARAFVRPSGTEDLLRVYVEANDPAHLDEIARQIMGQIRQLV